MAAVNRNQLWSEIIVEELIRSGVGHVCIAPGSRSTPLALAFYAQRKNISIHSHLDERSAAYFALGIGMATGVPAAVLCTSGTAAANFYPAIIEAYQARVPLLVLTADRAHEARGSGANQTIDQVKMYGDHVLWAVDVALPESNPAPVTLRSLRTTINRAVATTMGQLNIRKGPVHLNLPFRKPLEPVAVAGDNVEIPKSAAARRISRFTAYSIFPPTTTVLPVDYIDEIVGLCERRRGLIYCGAGTPETANYAIALLSKTTGFPILVDGLASMRFSAYQTGATLVSAYDSYLNPNIPQPDVLIRFGNVPTSTALINYFMALDSTFIVHFNDVWADDSHNVDFLVTADPAQAVLEVVRKLDPQTDFKWRDHWQKIDTKAWNIIEHELSHGEFFDGAGVSMLINGMYPDDRYFFGNSLPVRHLDQFIRHTVKTLKVYANRGASGIDGVISTALGVSIVNPEDGYLGLIIGDVSFYHDMNGLLAIKRFGIPIRIILLNNDGGGIFQRLPIKDYDPAFTDLFLTQHGLDFSHVAALYGLDYKLATTREEFEAAIARPITGAPNAQLIELRTDSAHDLARRQEIMAAVQAAIAPIIAQWKEQENS